MLLFLICYIFLIPKSLGFRSNMRLANNGKPPIVPSFMNIMLSYFDKAFIIWESSRLFLSFFPLVCLTVGSVSEPCQRHAMLLALFVLLRTSLLYFAKLTGENPVSFPVPAARCNAFVHSNKPASSVRSLKLWYTYSLFFPLSFFYYFSTLRSTVTIDGCLRNSYYSDSINLSS